MILRVDILERLLAKYADPGRFEYGWGYQKPTGERVRYPQYGARQPDPASWETNYATSQPGTAFRVGHTAEKQTTLPPPDAVAVESPQTNFRRLSGDVGSSRVHPGFATPGSPVGSGRKVWDGLHWNTEAPAPTPTFNDRQGKPLPQYQPYKAVGAPGIALPDKAPPVVGPSAGSLPGGAWDTLETNARRGKMTPEQHDMFKKLLENHGVGAVQRLYPGALE